MKFEKMNIKKIATFLIIAFFLISNPTFSQINSGVIKGSISGADFYGIIGLPMVTDAGFGNFEIGIGFPIVITGVDEQLNETWNISVYPTLVMDKFTVQCDNTTNRAFKIEIFDLLGNQILLDDINNRNLKGKVEINAQSIHANGIYFVRLSAIGSNFNKTFKIIKSTSSN